MAKRQTARSSGRRLYAEPALRPAPDMDRLIDLVLHLAEAEHRAARRARPSSDAGSEGSRAENNGRQGLPNEPEPKEH